MRWYRVPAALALAGVLFCWASLANSAVLITVDKAAQRMTVVVDGELRWIWPVSTGLIRYDTPNGRYGAFRMARKHFSREWDDAPMPHSIFFTQNGHAIHSSYATRRLGNAASHGCVRLAPKNAAQLFGLVQKHGLGNTLVVVQGALPGSVPTPIIAIPLPRERRAALRMVAALETPTAVREDASTAAENKPSTAAAMASGDKPAEEHMASARIAPQARERRAALPAAVELDTPAAVQRDASTPAERNLDAAAIAALRPDKPGEELRASAHVSPQPDERRAVAPAVTDADASVVIPRDRPIILESKPDTAVTALTPEGPAEGQIAAARIVAQPSEPSAELRAVVEQAMPVALNGAPAVADADPGETAVAAASPEAMVVEQREATRTTDIPPRGQAMRALPRPRALPQPPRLTKREPPQRAERKQPPRYAERSYDDPRVYRRSWSTDRPRVYRGRPRFAPRVYYDPPEEIIEEFYVNGQWVRRRYYRQAQPWDFYGYRHR